VDRGRSQEQGNKDKERRGVPLERAKIRTRAYPSNKREARAEGEVRRVARGDSQSKSKTWQGGY
jgi:hypothetical protein